MAGIQRTLGILAVLMIFCSLAGGSGCGGEGGSDSSGPAEAPTETSVCGGPVTSTPKVCELSLVRTASGAIAVRFGLSDKEGDIVQFCVGLGEPGTTPMCTGYFVGAPYEKTINAFGTQTLHLTEGLVSGATVAVYMQLQDTAGHSGSALADVQVP